MSSAALGRASRKDWLFANPWWWMGVGLVLSGAALAAARLLGDEPRWLRFTLVVAGLLAAGVGVRIRLDLARPAWLEHWSIRQRNLVLGLLMFLFAGLALLVTALWLMSLLGSERVPWRWGPLFLLWLVLGPLSATAAAQCFQRLRRREPLQPNEEASMLLVLAAATCFFASNALYLPSFPRDMDSLRMFLGVVTLIVVTAAPLVLVPLPARRQVISVLILLHFGGICTAALAVPPTPSVIAHLWVRIYRPYLEFFYINNAYHFYSPEPGPATYLWFRVIGTNNKGEEVGDWVKVPKIDDQGQQQHAAALSYSRHLALTENVTFSEPRNFYEIQPNGTLVPAEFYKRRLLNSPTATNAPAIVGVELPKPTMIVPFHPEIAQNQQYLHPSKAAAELIPSYVRHVMLDYQATHPDIRVTSAKMYRVVHSILPPELFANTQLDPVDPTLYRGVFMGQFDREGKVIDKVEPFLYWLLPTLKDDPTSLTSKIKCYTRRHAGDPLWMRDEDGKWIDPEAQP